MERETILISLIDPSPLNPPRPSTRPSSRSWPRPPSRTASCNPFSCGRAGTQSTAGRRKASTSVRTRGRRTPLAPPSSPAWPRSRPSCVTCRIKRSLKSPWSPRATRRLARTGKSPRLQKLIDEHGYTADTLAAKIGRSPATVYGLLKLLQLPTAAAKALEAGELPANTALLFARIPKEKLRAQASRDLHGPRNAVAAGGKGKDPGEIHGRVETGPFPPKDRHVAAQCRSLHRLPQTDRQQPRGVPRGTRGRLHRPRLLSVQDGGLGGSHARTGQGRGQEDPDGPGEQIAVE